MNEPERPTALIRRVDLSASGQRASGAPATSELDLFHALRGTGNGIETQRCLCGGFVHADPVSPAKGVAAHQYTSRHKAWRLWREDCE